MIQEEGRDFQNFAAEVLELSKRPGGIISVRGKNVTSAAKKQ